ncbi:MAG: ATP-binding protein [Acidobacteriota bacterium]|nr:ATP-binding protein [Acidobacteriota bacterium]
MKYFPLHIKTALLASLVSFVVLIVGLIVVSANVAKQIQAEQKELAALQAENLAGQLSAAQNRFNAEGLKNLANVLSGSRPNLVTVRVWNFENGKFVETVASNDSLPVEDLDKSVSDALLKGVGSSTVNVLPNKDDSLFRVFSPIVRDGQITGAVEAVERLDTISSITFRYIAKLSWVTLLTVFFMSAAFYLLFQRLVYQPLGRLLAAMDEAKTGNLTVAVAEQKDEFGRLSNGFNSMMRQIREMTSERTRQNEILQEKVSAATSELTQKNEHLENANLELFRAARKMSEMERLAAAGQTAAEFAHEVGTPLNLISGHVQILQTNFPKESKDATRLQTITAQIERIKQIVREMLDRTRFGASEHSPLDLNELLQKTFDAVEPTLVENRVELKIDLAENLSLIEGDADRLQQVFLNLVNNALDAMPAGGKLEISTAFDASEVAVEFMDNGAGMDEDTSGKIFQPLFTTNERGRGTGLGLFVVNRILHEHAAKITVESEPERGTKFRLLFQKI